MVCLPGRSLLSCLYGMWSSMKMPLDKEYKSLSPNLNTSTSDSTKTDELSPDDDVNSEKPVKRENIN